jgi:glycosyltransferase involved in cell wall biosynthesis
LQRTTLGPAGFIRAIRQYLFALVIVRSDFRSGVKAQAIMASDTLGDSEAKFETGRAALQSPASPKISIVTAVWNRAETVVSALRSLKNQDYPFVEHVVIDGCSTDGTLDLIRDQEHDSMIVVSEPDDGIYDALNKGIKLASGDIVGLLHSDDEFAHPGVLSLVADEFRASDVAVVFGDVSFFRANNRDAAVRRYRSDRFTPAKLPWGWMPAHPAMFFRRELFDTFGYYRTDYKIAADFEFVARVLKQPEVKYSHLPEVLVRMQLGGASTAGFRSTVELNREVLRALRENGFDTNMFKVLSKYPLKLLEYLRF